LLALYALTPAFYFIPDAVLAAVVIHAVADLVSGPSYVKRLAAVSLWELLIFASTVIITFFTTVEYGIYASVGMSIVILLFRIARPRFWGLGRIPLSTAISSASCDDEKKQRYSVSESQNYLYVPESHPSLGKLVEPLPEGILMCRVDESFTYPNSSFISDKIITYCKKRTRSNGKFLTKGERQWNDDATPALIAARENLPRLHALILDFASVNRLDSSGLQAIVDAQNTLNRYSGHHVEFHFVNILHPAIRRCLIVAQFGTQPRPGDNNKEILPVVPASRDGPQHQQPPQVQTDAENQIGSSVERESEDDDNKRQEFVEVATASVDYEGGGIPLPKDRYPFFHWSSDEAVRSALDSLSIRQFLEESDEAENTTDGGNGAGH
jgi:sodium-independent sulfate anion transporter 11